MSLRLFNIFLLLTLASTPLFCQTNTIDSLKNLLGDENDTTNFRIYNELGNAYGNINLDSSLIYYHQGLDLAIKQNNKIYTSKFHNNIGANYFYKGWYKIAQQHFRNSLDIRFQLSDTTELIKALNNLGRLEQKLGNFDEASENLFMALQLADLTNDTFRIGYITGNIGSFYFEQDEIDIALRYYRKSLVFSEKANSLKDISETYNRIGMLYQTLNQIDSSLFYLNLSLQLNQQSNNKIGQSDILLSIGSTYLQNEDYEKAYKYFNKALELNLNLDSKYTTATTYEHLGKYYFKINKINTALEYFHKVIYFRQKQITPFDLKNIYQKLSEVHKAATNYDSALYYYEQYTLQKDSIFTLEKSRQIAELEAIYQTEKKEKEIIQLEKEKEGKQSQMRLLVILIILLTLLVVFSYIFYRIRQKTLILKAVSSEQKKQFKAVLNAQEDERKRIAAELHDSVGPLLSVSQLYISDLIGSEQDDPKELSQLCSKSLNALNEATSEIRDISHNLMPGALIRIGLVAACKELIRKIKETKAFDINLDVIDYEERPDATIELCFYRIFQELMNNIIKHSKATEVEIILSQTDKVLGLSVKDNGIGFNPNRNNSKGIGMQSIYSRISLVGGEIKIDSNEKGTHTKIWVNV